MSRKVIFGVLLACIPWCLLAQDQTLRWDALRVAAHLDAQGVLHIVETHTMVFDGAWNGGERVFRLASGQDLEFKSFSEIDSATGSKTPWADGNLERVGEFRLNRDTLRWRARMPDDPPFENAIKTYEISYALSGVLIEQDGRYRLSHDFAFPDRDGEIRVFDASLSLDPLWQTETPLQWHVENLPPGQSVIVDVAFDYLGDTAPAALGVLPPTDTPTPMRFALLSVLVLFILLHVAAFVRRERTRGRFRPVPSVERIDEAWLAEHVFAHRPEVVGAAWDLYTSSAEVAALLARLAQAGLLKTEVRTEGSGWLKRETLYMELACERDRFKGYERALIDGFFVDGPTIDMTRLRKHYAKRGFSPGELIRKGIEQQLPDAFAQRLPVPKWIHVLTAVLIVGSLVAFVLSAIRAVDIFHVLIITLFVMMFVFMFGLVLGFVSSTAVGSLRGKLIAVGICIALLGGIATFLLIGRVVPIESWGALSVTLLAAGFINAIFSAMWIRQTPQTLALRQQFALARRYFERELRAQQPRLQDEWFPYLLAFGLGSHVDKWFKAFGKASGSNFGATSAIQSPSIARGGASSSGWTGGGGTFGGAGASGTWASAVSGIASGVSSPSSSSSSGRSSTGGSSRSGGGGGGGW